MGSNVSTAKILRLSGTIQGVGFRPFVYRLAKALKLAGDIKNTGTEVSVFVQGNPEDINEFIYALQTDLPPLANINTLEKTDSELRSDLSGFSIAKSSAGKVAQHNIKDYALCKDCLLEFNHPDDRRYQYPFISCTNCGPRYAVLQRFPLDRINTSLKNFPLCKKCKAEYETPSNRRFHAQNISCADCGPKYTLHLNTETEHSLENIIHQCCKLLLDGHILCVKGMTGYRLFCDAENETSIAILRDKKHRPDKPFAIMFPELDNFALLNSHLQPDSHDIVSLSENTRPIILIHQKSGSTLAKNVAPGLGVIGAMLPATGFEHLLINTISKPLIATSANSPGGRTLTDNAIARKKMAHITTFFLHHNLPIEHGLDDSVFKENMPIRLGRAYAPAEYKLPFTLNKTVLALGAQSKNTFALAWSDRVIVSPYLGSMDNADVWQHMQKQLNYFQSNNGVTASHYLIDRHPGYTSHQWVKNHALSHSKIQHHHAHASALMFEHKHNSPALVFTWDGTGYGDDDLLWGGEGLYGEPGNWQRVFSFRQFKLPGGRQAINQPWRIAASLNWHAGDEWRENINQATSLKQIWNKNINCPLTSSVGRLFDAAAVYLGLINRVSYDGQAAMLLEAVAVDKTHKHITLNQVKAKNGIYSTDWEPLIKFLQDGSQSIEYRATVFHHSLAQVILSQTEIFAKKNCVKTIGLTGGVFQNAFLVKITQALLSSKGYAVLTNRQIPPNDASISLGQIIEYGMRCGQKNH